MPRPSLKRSRNLEPLRKAGNLRVLGLAPLQGGRPEDVPELHSLGVVQPWTIFGPSSLKRRHWILHRQALAALEGRGRTSGSLGRYLASRGCYRAPGCGKAGERADRLAPSKSMSRGLSAAHHRRWAAYAMSLGFRV